MKFQESSVLEGFRTMDCRRVRAKLAKTGLD
jgi:hypothetical protein